MSYLEDFSREEKPVLLQFYADWCMPCKALSPMIDMIEDRAKGQIIVHRINIDTSPEIVAEFEISSVPTMVMLKDGAEVWGFTGLMSPVELKREIEYAASVKL
ncbi:thioredoxin family protein [Taibaiella chishuiensis]|uniref:Thioredoxin n=1 Tax=Taibaiella chishuiensis TaxID=1434707 RepID=A0A2P8DAW5_9BACT|nr:thioredoxin domain-containing protein [Taibaiella chishuiensis]PSK94358.1 thioredoxin 1 [Taibaiella chishuiensis]